jgi:hypothetical protein
MKTATITKSKFIKGGQSQHGPWWMFALELSNGAKGSAFLKSEDNPEGRACVYDAEETTTKDGKTYTNLRGLKLTDDSAPKETATAGHTVRPDGTITTAAGLPPIEQAPDAKERRISMLSCISSAAQYYQQRECKAGEMEALALRLYHLALTQKVDGKAVTDNLPF